MARSGRPEQSCSSAARSASTDAAAATQWNFGRFSSFSCWKRPAVFLSGRGKFAPAASGRPGGQKRPARTFFASILFQTTANERLQENVVSKNACLHNRSPDASGNVTRDAHRKTD